MSSKLQKAGQLLLTLAKLPFTDTRPVEPDQALAILQQLWPDGGKAAIFPPLSPGRSRWMSP